jgi:hypothetical protein
MNERDHARNGEVQRSIRRIEQKQGNDEKKNSEGNNAKRYVQES